MRNVIRASFIAAILFAVLLLGQPAEATTDVTKFMGQTGWRSVQAVTATTSGLAPAGGGRADRFLNGTGAMASILTTQVFTAVSMTPIATPAAPTTGCVIYSNINASGRLEARFSSGNPVTIATHP
jgi:hypothetical protein